MIDHEYGNQLTVTKVINAHHAHILLMEQYEAFDNIVRRLELYGHIHWLQTLYTYWSCADAISIATFTVWSCTDWTTKISNSSFSECLYFARLSVWAIKVFKFVRKQAISLNSYKCTESSSDISVCDYKESKKNDFTQDLTDASHIHMQISEYF